MRLSIKLILCHLLGIAGHQLHHIITPLQFPTTHIPPVGAAWYRHLRYAIGGMMIGIMLFIMLSDHDDRDAILMEYFGGLVFLGAGVAAGYWWDEK